MKLANGETENGVVFCADPVSNVVALCDDGGSLKIVSLVNTTHQQESREAQIQVADSADNFIHSQQALEERERRAIRIAEETLRNLNPKVLSLFCHSRCESCLIMPPSPTPGL